MPTDDLNARIEAILPCRGPGCETHDSRVMSECMEPVCPASFRFDVRDLVESELAKQREADAVIAECCPVIGYNDSKPFEAMHNLASAIAAAIRAQPREEESDGNG